MSGKIQLLRQYSFFSALNEEELQTLSALISERNFYKNEIVFHEGTSSNWFYIVKEGKIKIFKNTPLGKELILGIFTDGEMVGTIAAFENKPYPASAQVISKNATLLQIKRGAFLSFLAKKPEVSLKIISTLGERLKTAHNKMRDFSSERVETRIARILFNLSMKFGNSLSFSRQEIADMAGTTIETAIRVTSRFKQAKVISSERGKITIINKEKLQALAEGPPISN